MITPQNILVIRFSSLGDIVLATPLLRALRARFPSAHIDFIVRKEYAELVKYNPNLTKCYEFDTTAGFSGLQKLKKRLRTERYDLVIDIHNSIRSRYLRIWLDAQEVVLINKRMFARIMFVKFKKNLYGDTVSVADRYIEPVTKFGVQNDGAGLELPIPDEISARAGEAIALSEINRSGSVIGLCPSAKHATKCWPSERFAELGSGLIQTGETTILLFGGPSDVKTCSTIAQTIRTTSKASSIIDLSGKLSLLETAAAMKFCDVIVTNDSGLMHIAAAMKRKVVALFGSTVREFGFFPVGTENIVIERAGLYCRPCSHIGCSECPEGHFRCMKEIRVDEVEQCVRRFLGTGNN